MKLRLFVPGPQLAPSRLPPLFLLLAATFAPGCASDATQVHQAIHSAITHTVDSLEQAVLATSAYRQANGHWPADFDELKAFASQRKLSLDQVQSLEFVNQNDGGVMLNGQPTPFNPSDEPSKFHITLPPDMDIAQAAKIRNLLKSSNSLPQ